KRRLDPASPLTLIGRRPQPPLARQPTVPTMDPRFRGTFVSALPLCRALAHVFIRLGIRLSLSMLLASYIASQAKAQPLSGDDLMPLPGVEQPQLTDIIERLDALEAAATADPPGEKK